MKITIISVGKIKESYLIEFINEYSKRLKKYCSLEFIELKDEVLRDDSNSGIEIVLEKEAVLIDKYLNNRAYKIALAIEGKQYNSVDFASNFVEIFNNYSHIQFIIGGSYGISKSIKNKCNELISISMMTFPHNIAKCLLLEQVYRCYKIMNNEVYHK